MSKTIFFEYFLSFEDASMWIERHLDDLKKTDMRLHEAKIHFVNGGWGASIAFGSSQLEFNLDAG